MRESRISSSLFLGGSRTTEPFIPSSTGSSFLGVLICRLRPLVEVRERFLDSPLYAYPYLYDRRSSLCSWARLLRSKFENWDRIYCKIICNSLIGRFPTFPNGPTATAASTILLQLIGTRHPTLVRNIEPLGPR